MQQILSARCVLAVIVHNQLLQYWHSFGRGILISGIAWATEGALFCKNNVRTYVNQSNQIDASQSKPNLLNHSPHKQVRMHILCPCAQRPLTYSSTLNGFPRSLYHYIHHFDRTCTLDLWTGCR